MKGRCAIPCWEINILSVEFQAENFDVLGKVVTAMGLRYTVLGKAMAISTASGQVTIADGRATGDARAVNLLVNPLRVAYAKECVRTAAQRNGWQVSSMANNRMVVQKR